MDVAAAALHPREIPRGSFACCCGGSARPGTGTTGAEVMLFHILELHIGIHIRSGMRQRGGISSTIECVLCMS